MIFIPLSNFPLASSTIFYVSKIHEETSCIKRFILDAYLPFPSLLPI